MLNLPSSQKMQVLKGFFEFFFLLWMGIHNKPQNNYDLSEALVYVGDNNHAAMA
jgi:hypothetical protein